MDVYEDPSLGPFDEGQVQIHDFNPGDLNPPGEPSYFMDGGVFWTRRIPERSVKMRPGRGDARFALSNFHTLDYLNVINAIFRTGPDPIPSRGSVDIEWNGTGQRMHVENEAAGFRGRYENASAHIEWSASSAAGYHFSTANSSETHITHAFTAHVQSGAFFG